MWEAGLGGCASLHLVADTADLIGHKAHERTARPVLLASLLRGARASPFFPTVICDHAGRRRGSRDNSTFLL